MILLTGGGTGGHLFPALAVAEELRRRGHPVFYLGAEGAPGPPPPQDPHPPRPHPRGEAGPERPEAPGGPQGAPRGSPGPGPPPAPQAQGGAQHRGVRRLPRGMAASLLGIPLLLHEQNARLGLANRALAPLAKGLALSVPLALPAPLARKARVVGYPVREVRYPKDEAKRRLGFDPQRPLLLVLGGSQGSLELNERLPPVLKGLPVQVLHQVGERWVERFRPLEGGLPGGGLRGHPLAMSAADLLLSRAGAGTLAEAAFHGLPAILFPLSPKLDGGAQLANARAYAQAGGRFWGRGTAFPPRSSRPWRTWRRAEGPWPASPPRGRRRASPTFWRRSYEKGAHHGH